MKTAIRIAAALAVLAIATPVLACSEAKPTTADAGKGDAKKQVASADKTAAQTTVKTAPATK